MSPGSKLSSWKNGEDFTGLTLIPKTSPSLMTGLNEISSLISRFSNQSFDATLDGSMDCGDKKFSGEDGSDLFSTSAWALEQGIVESKNTLNGYKNGANETSVEVNTNLLDSFFGVPSEIGAVPSDGTDWTEGWSDI